MPALTIEITTAADRTQVQVAGEIDLSSKDQLEDRLSELCTMAPHVDLDLSEVSFIDSTGVNMLLRMHQAHVAAGGTLTIRRPSPSVQTILEITALGSVIPIVGS